MARSAVKAGASPRRDGPSVDTFGVSQPTQSRRIATALAILAVEAGYRGYFTSADDMVRTLGHAIVGGTFASKLRSYISPSVVVIDDVGLIQMGRTEATAFFQVVNCLVSDP
jgi:DNA replication protein DnaC